MQMLAYYCATGFRKINVIESGQISEIYNIPKEKAETCTIDDVFLDNTTGDFYFYKAVFFTCEINGKKETMEWSPAGNIGLHNTKAAEKFGSLGSYFIKKMQNTAKTLTNQDIYLNNMYEQIVKVKKSYIQHWTVRNISKEFKVACYNKWDVHPINILNAETIGSNYSTIAESHRGPIIAEHDKVCIVVQFNIEKKYPETLQILDNFIFKMAEEVKTCSLIQNRVEQPKNVNEKLRPKSTEMFGRRLVKVKSEAVIENQFKTTMGKISIQKHTNKFAHTGFSYAKKKGIYIPENNATGQRTVKINILPKNSTSKTPTRTISRMSNLYGSCKTFDLMPAIISNQNIKEEPKIVTINKQTISRMLHPSLKIEFIQTERSPVEKFKKHKLLPEAPPCRFNEFQKMFNPETFSKSVRSSTPYSTYDELIRKEALANKKKWIAGCFKL